MLMDGSRSQQAEMSSLECHREQFWVHCCFPESVKASDPRLFADNCLLYKFIKCDADAESVQQDLALER